MPDHEDIRRSLAAELRTRFGVEPAAVRTVWSPYRICPLGAHIDHQLGTVTATALDLGTHVAFAPSTDGTCRLASRNCAGEESFSLAEPGPPTGGWGDYARGAARALARSGPLNTGLVGLVAGELLEGGLSSSASVGLACLLALAAVNERRLSASELIRLDQAIETDYLGLNNGILDQAAILLSRAGTLTVIDCLAFAAAESETPDETAPPPGVSHVVPEPPAPPFAILVAHSGLTRAIVSTDYNRRVEECAEAARTLLAAVGRPTETPKLRHVSPAEYAAHRSMLKGAPARRAAHFFSEMTRVREGIEAWRHGDLAKFGRLMNASGRSSLEQYECGSPPLVDLWEILRNTPGVYGARFSGAGFRGCCVALVDPAAVTDALPDLQRRYAARQPDLANRARLLLRQPADGARLLP